jgi:CubicO group peptidase (beta-lactamase class C family)
VLALAGLIALGSRAGVVAALGLARAGVLGVAVGALPVPGRLLGIGPGSGWGAAVGGVAAVPGEAAVPAVLVAAAEGAVGDRVGQAFPGAALAVGVGGRIERVTALGRIGWRDSSPPVEVDRTLYDLASLTKAVATTVAVLLLVEEGRIGLDDPVQRWLPEFEGKYKDEVTWRHLLTHTSGVAPGTRLRGSSPRERLANLLRKPLGARPGLYVMYSDPGYVVLWTAAERVAGEPLPAYLERKVWRPLGMTSTAFAPGQECTRCAPTLMLRSGEPFRGRPSDLFARELGGVTGNAGLFSTVLDLARFAAMIAGDGELDGVRILRPATVRELLRQQPGAGRRTLGWTAFCPDEPFDAGQPCARPVAYGHTGWTGTSLMIEPGRRVWVVLLSNRSFGRPGEPPSLDTLRSAVFSAVAAPARPAPRTRRGGSTRRRGGSRPGRRSGSARRGGHGWRRPRA